MQGAVAQPVMATLVHDSVAAVYPSASVEVQGEPMGTPVASMPLAEMVEILKREIGVGGTIQSVVQGAAQQLGIAHQGQPLMQTAQLCLAVARRWVTDTVPETAETGDRVRE